MFHEPFFPASEFEARHQRAWQTMEAAELDALIGYSPGNQFWLVGFQGSLSAKRFPEFAHHVIYPKTPAPSTAATAPTTT